MTVQLLKFKSGSLTLMVTILLVVVWQFAIHHSEIAKPLRVGETFPEATAFDLQKRLVHWPKGPFLVLYSTADSGIGIQIAKYVQIRLTTGHLALPAIIILKKQTSASAIARFQQEVGACFPIVVDDGTWTSRLSVETEPFFLFVVGQQQRILFSTSFAQQEDIRQLSEKVLAGEISYAVPDQIAPLRLGDKVAPFEVTDLRRGDENTWQPEANTSVVFFTARCPECSLVYQLKAVAKHESTNPELSAKTIVFSSRFPREDLVGAARQLGIHAQLLQAHDNIPGIENAFDLQIHTPTDISVIQTGPERKIVQILSLDEYLHAGRKE